jgi:hypothetical protein
MTFDYTELIKIVFDLVELNKQIIKVVKTIGPKTKTRPYVRGLLNCDEKERRQTVKKIEARRRKARIGNQFIKKLEKGSRHSVIEKRRANNIRRASIVMNSVTASGATASYTESLNVW